MSANTYLVTRRTLCGAGATVLGTPLLLAACSPGGASPAAPTAQPATKPAPTAERQRVELATYVLNDVRDKSMQEMVEAAAKIANVELVRSPIPATASDFAQKFTTQAVSGTAPDVVVMGEPDVMGWAAGGFLLDLDPFMARDKVNPNDMNGMLAYQWKNKQYALPFQAPGETWFFNRRLFAEANVPLPKPDWTFEDLAELARKLTKGDGPTKQWGLEHTGGGIPYGLATMILHNGGMVLNEPRNKALWGDDARAIEAAQFDLRLRDEGLTPRPGQVDPPPKFEDGRASMTSSAFHVAANLRDKLGDDLWFIRPPRGKAPAYFAYMDTNAWSIASGTKVREGAWRMVKALASDEVDKLWAPAGTPSAKKAAESPEYLKLFPGREKELRDLLDAWGKRPRDRFVTPDARRWWGEVGKAFTPMYKGEQGVTETMRQSAEAVNEIFASFPSQYR